MNLLALVQFTEKSKCILSSFAKNIAKVNELRYRSVNEGYLVPSKPSLTLSTVSPSNVSSMLVRVSVLSLLAAPEKEIYSHFLFPFGLLSILKIV